MHQFRWTSVGGLGHVSAGGAGSIGHVTGQVLQQAHRTLFFKTLKSLLSDPAGFAPRAGSALLERARLAAFRRRSPQRGAVVHYGVHRNGNAGDTALFAATRLLFENHLGRQDWIKLPVRSTVRPADVERINRHAKAVLVGGGGLIIPDSVSASQSGWQWNIALADLKRLEVPLVLSAVGYNTFHGQSAFAQKFAEHVTETVSRAAFVGLRNTGSIRSLAAHLPDDLAAKLRFQPCPTTVLGKLLPRYAQSGATARGRHLSINLAYDRAERRFNGKVEECVAEIADAARHLASQGWRVTVALHDPRDRFFLPLLRNSGLRFDVVDIAHARLPAILAFYQGVDLTIGMRGHGQMVPFGLGGMIFTLSSHPKMNYFLEDIGQTQWGVDIRTPGFRDALIAGMEAVIADPVATRQVIHAEQDRLWNLMAENLRLCAPHFA
ncbi:polysaccharide pyruvyl transferase family protein [Novosphingobium colocasiae]|uniref:polysaccharide pyruvyl transferase family protein n=1 Tax=Novosphingobium colocasiae TaxID=1256513 RepID=UPI0035B4DF74